MKIAIDGPSGAGKSEIADVLAEKLNIPHINTGSIYRAYTLFFLENNIDCNNRKLVKNNFLKADIGLKFNGTKQETYLNGRIVDSILRTEDISVNSAVISQYKFIREKVVQIQRSFAESNNIIIEGRDIGSVVLPNAEYKFFLTASAKVRAERRFNQLKQKGENVELVQVYEDLLKRDYFDLHRKVSPLKQCKDSILIYTDELTFEQVANKILEYIERKN